MVRQLSHDVWQFELRGVNAYFVRDDVPTLVDAGTPFDTDWVRENLDDIGVGVGDVERVLLSHYDFDHVGTLADLAAEMEATVYAGTADADVLTGRESPPFGNHNGAFQRLAGLFVSKPDLEVVAIQDGATVGSFTAYHTPGHTPGHLAFVSEDLDVGFLGDLVSESDGELKASGWVISYDTDTVHESIVDLAERAPDFSLACAGHGTPLMAGGSRALRSLADELGE